MISFNMTNYKNKRCLKHCETIFACVVIVSCLVTLMTSFISPPVRRRTGQHHPGIKNSILKQAQESFQIAMIKLRSRINNTTFLGAQEESGHDSVVSESKQSRPENDLKDWFKDKNTIKYPAHTRKHPVLTKAILSNNALCDKTSVDILIYFHSKWDNFKRRSVLRETWASTKTFTDINIRTLFILGKPPSKKDQLRINSEAALYSDILQGNFTDNFNNITLKSVHAVQWINDNCLQAKYILKADDDMFVNIFTTV